MKKVSLIAAGVAVIFASCHNSENDFDAAGAFESVETIVSTEATGSIMQLNVEEGQTLQPEAEKNQARMNNLFKQNAATQQQVDDANTQVDMITKQIEAQKSSLGISSNTIEKDVAPLQRQIDQLNDQLAKCRIINPIHGTVLTKYSEDHEVVMPGKALYKIAETDTLILRAYITGDQLDKAKLGQKVKVRVDKGAKQYAYYDGLIYWVSDKAEFTPKTIPTKEERADLVYAIKIRVINDGFLKIGMYGEMSFK
jgi:HlyD family secretion protein